MARMYDRDKYQPSGGKMVMDDGTVLDEAAVLDHLDERTINLVTTVWTEQVMEPILAELRIIRRHLEVLTGEIVEGE